MNPEEPIKSVEGRVVGADIGQWAGFPAGPVTLELSDGSRIELRYDKDTIGAEPIVGMKIAVDYVGDQLLLLKRIRLLPEEPRLLSHMPSESYLYTRFGVPPAALVISVVVFLCGASFIIWGIFGDFYPAYAANTTFTLGAFGVLWIIFAYGIWWYSSKN
ncbi:MAG: hypothetical protein RTU92_05355 [Candidatus Thorarchaeota archaeon]